MHKNLRPYQQNLLDKIYFNPNNKILVQAATGFGKTVVFSQLAENHKGRVLILVDSSELVKQTANHIKGAGTFEAKNKEIPKNNIIISMAQTLNSRLKKKPELIKDFDLIIIDECHVLVYLKILEHISENSKIIGFTATPVNNRKDNYLFCFEHKIMSCTCDSEKIEFTKDFALSEIFDDIIIGVPISELINQGFLIPDENYAIAVDDSDFEFDKFGEVSNSDEVFDSNYQMDVLANYNQYCKGKKTMIFTQNTKLNKFLFDMFQESGVENCLMYDSVNDSNYSRSEVVEKFRSTKGAILFNVSCYVKGFDVTDVECIIVSRRISSLSLWIQIVGRGSRPTDKVFKDKFTVIDGGTNIKRFGQWSSDFDWEKLFWGKDDYKPKKEALEEMVKQCDGCGEYIPERQCICEKCNHNNCKVKEIQIESGLATQVNTVAPSVEKIINFAKSKDKDKIFALKVLTDQFVKMFKNIDKEQFERNRTGGVERVISTTYKKAYLQILRSDLTSNVNRTFNQQRKILISKLEKNYDI